MADEAVSVNQVLVLAALAMAFGGLWQWSGWLRWPTEPDRKPLGRMVPIEALAAFGVYVAAQLNAGVLYGIYLGIKHKIENPTSTQPFTIGHMTAAEIFGLQLFASVPVLIYFGVRCWPKEGETDRQTGLEHAGFWKLAWLGVVAGVSVIPLMILVNVGVQEMGVTLFDAERPKEGHELLKMLINAPTLWNYIFIGLSAVVIAPVVEEVMFRGMVQGNLRPRGRGTAIAVSAIVFALVHVSSVPWQVLPALALLGVMLSLMFERTGVIWPGMIAHATFNLCNLAMAILITPTGEK